MNLICQSVLISTALCSAGAWAGPVQSAWSGAGGEAVGAASLSGWYACASTSTDSVEFRDIRGDLMGSLTRTEIQALLPWMTLDASADGPSAIAMSDSGRLAFVLIHDDESPADGLGGDAILRLDTDTWTTTVFVRDEFSNATTGHATTALAFYAGRLMAGSSNGVVRTYNAGRNMLSSSLLSTRTVGFGVEALAVDRENDLLYVGAGGILFETDAINAFSGMSVVTSIPGVRGLAHSSQYGVTFPFAGGAGLYAVDNSGQVSWISGTTVQAYATVDAGTTDLVATASGSLLIASDSSAIELREGLDGRLGFEDWLNDEFHQVLSYAKGLVSPDGEPAGWVIDADVAVGGTRFHPPSPDAACWTVLLLMVSEDLTGDPEAKPLIRSILTRYAGLAPDGIGPGWSADGHIQHWPGPLSTTGAPKAGWPDELASLSTMKIILAAARAAQRYPNDPEIRAAAAEIIGRTTTGTFDNYILSANSAVSLLSLGSSPNTSITNPPFSEAIIFVDEAADLGTAYSQGKLAEWLNRNNSPSASYITGRPISVISSGNFQAAFLSLYPLLVMDDYRNDPAWRENVQEVRAAHAAWTDENAPRWFTVFSAGTTKPAFGGYRADSLSNHPGDFATFPSLMAFGAEGRTPEAVAAYQAYRSGARQAWETGASFLYRRSNPDPGYLPNTAGLPDVALGALGLAELISPGVIDRVLLGGYQRISACQVDLNGDGVLDNGDIGAFIALFIAGDLGADMNGDGFLDNGDISAFIAAFLAGC